MEERAEQLARYIVENRATARTAAQKFGISKSTVRTGIITKQPQHSTRMLRLL